MAITGKTALAMAFSFAAYAAFADQNIVISANQTAPIAIGDLSTPVAESHIVTVNTDATVDYSGTGNAFTAYMGGNADITLNNNGTLSSADRGIFAMTTQGSSGEISISNLAGGNIQADKDYAVYMYSSNNRSMNFINHGEILGNGATPSEDHGGTVVMHSTGNSDITFTNTGTIIGLGMKSDGGVVTASTGGSVNISNSGDIYSGFDGSGGDSGILVGADARGGLIVNTGVIRATTAIDVKGSGITVQLRKNLPGNAGDIIGNIDISQGINNTLSMDAINQVNIDGNVNIGHGNSLELVLAGAQDGIAFLKASGIIDIDGSNLVLDESMLSVGDTYEILNGNSISGWFESINSVAISDYDPNAIYAVGGYEIKFTMNGGTLSMEVVPEPADYATALALISAAAAACRLRRKNSRHK